MQEFKPGQMLVHHQPSTLRPGEFIGKPSPAIYVAPDVAPPGKPASDRHVIRVQNRNRPNFWALATVKLPSINPA